jgi:gluconate 2-dehydrogenase gamma chain
VAIGNEGRYGHALEHLKIHSLRRRKFLRIAGTATACGALVSCGRQSTPWRFLTAAEGRTLDAVCEQIVPTDQTPGAAWAGVVNFIDRQLMGPYRRQQGAYRSGLMAIDEAAAARFGKSFVDLDASRQTALLNALTGPAKRFFSTVIAHTMQGYYGDPRHGGNRDAVSWRMLGVPVIPIRGRLRYDLSKQGA